MKRKLLNSFASLLFALAAVVLFAPLVGTVSGFLIGAAFFALSLVPAIDGVLGLNSTNNFTARDGYAHAKRMFVQAFLDNFKGDEIACMRWVESLKLSQSEVRLEVGLNTTSNSFSFGVTPNQANSSNIIFNTENRLQMQDSLCVYEYGIFVAQPSGQTDTAYKLCTYGNTQVFAAADAAALDSTFYANGSFRVTCNNDVLIPYRGLFNHYYAPQTQQTAPVGAGSPKDQQRGAEDGFITAEPNLVLIGSKSTIPQIVLPSALASASANLRCILIFRGVLAQNSTVVS